MSFHLHGGLVLGYIQSQVIIMPNEKQQSLSVQENANKDVAGVFPVGR